VDVNGEPERYSVGRSSRFADAVFVHSTASGLGAASPYRFVAALRRTLTPRPAAGRRLMALERRASAARLFPRGASPRSCRPYQELRAGFTAGGLPRAVRNAARPVLILLESASLFPAPDFLLLV